MTIEEFRDYCRTSWLAWFFLPSGLRFYGGYGYPYKGEPDKNNLAYAPWVAKVCVEFESAVKQMGFFRRWLFADIIKGFAASDAYKAYENIVLQTEENTSIDETYILQQTSFSRLFQTNESDERIAEHVAMKNDHVMQGDKKIIETEEPVFTNRKNSNLAQLSFVSEKIPLTVSERLIYAFDKKLEDVKDVMTQNSDRITQDMLEEPLRRAALNGNFDVVEYFVTLEDPKLNKECIADALDGAIIGCQTEVLNYLLSLTGDYAPDITRLKRKSDSRLLNLCRDANDEDLSHTRADNVRFIVNLEGELKPDTRLINKALRAAVAYRTRWDVVKLLIHMDGDNKPDAESIAFARQEAERYDIVLDEIPKQANRL